MPYFLNHHFDPDFDHQKLSPQALEGGGVDHRKLGYVQNVLQGDVLANWKEIPPGEESDYDARFVHERREFPTGHNCRVDPEDPDRLLAGANGYVFYLDGTINVKKVLNIRGDVDYHTGNIRFVNDIIVHGTVRSGFEVTGENVRVYGNVNGARVMANHALQVDGGIKGSKKADIRSKGTIKVGFCENAILCSGRDILIQGACYHSDLLAPRLIVIKGRFYGGNVYSRGSVFVQERVGCGMGGRTSCIMGFDPGLLRKGKLLGRKIAGIKAVLDQMTPADKNDSEKPADQETLAESLDQLMDRYRNVWKAIESSFNPSARLVVPGEVLPGVDISIGPAHYRVEEPLQDVCFFFKNHELCHSSPALDR